MKLNENRAADPDTSPDISKTYTTKSENFKIQPPGEEIQYQNRCLN